MAPTDMKSSLVEKEYEELETAEEEEEEVVVKQRSWFAGVEGEAPPPAPPLLASVITFGGVVGSIAALGLLTKFTGVIFLVGAAGAMVTILFAVIKAPVAQPRNCILGNTIGGFVGVSVFKLFELCGVEPATAPWAAGALAVGLTVFLQERTRSVHPPGGATALIFILGPAPIQALGWSFILSPALSMACLMTLFAFGFNRAAGKEYPQYWW